MSDLNDTPAANRIRIAFFGLRNAGKSTLVNEFAGQDVAIVSEVAGTTTDPVSKAMEILPLGPCLLTDTAGLDDVGELGELRVRKTLAVLAAADVAVWVSESSAAHAASGDERRWRARFDAECRRRGVAVLEYRRGDSVEALKFRIAALKVEAAPALLEGMVAAGERVVCVCPIDESAPKGRLILPQVQVIRECLDRHLVCTVCQPSELAAALGGGERTLVVTDSQAFREVDRIVAGTAARLTSFSILFARQKGDLAEFERGLDAISKLKDGDVVLVAEGCTHHRQCNDIGTTKIPKAVTRLAGGKKLKFVFASGGDFPSATGAPRPALIVHCGGCMLSRRMMLGRIEQARKEKIPIANYGLVLHRALTCANMGGS